MKNRQIITILLVLVAVAVQAQIHYRLEGTIGDSTFNTRLLLNQGMSAMKLVNAAIDTLEVVGGKLIPTEGTLEEPASFDLKSVTEGDEKPDIQSPVFIIEDGTMRIHFNQKAEEYKAPDSPLNRAFSEFVDFAVEYNGKTTRLSDYVGRGKYVLVDFWASWCGPCRQEIPNLISLYEKYKDKEFLVLGVAVQDNPEASLKAIDEMQIPYPQILNTQKIATNLYGIDIIPETILFAPDGTILARGLHGEEIEQQLQKTFNNK